MQLGGEQIVLASQLRTWQALNDPEILRQCIPGCEAIVPTEDQAYRVEMAARIGPVSARFKGRLRLLDINPPHSYSLEFDGQGGTAGFGKGKAAVRLEPAGAAGEHTKLNYTVEASVGGKLAQIGSRLIDSAARKLSEDFFTKFNAVMSAGAPASEAVAPEVAVGDSPATARAAPSATPVAAAVPAAKTGGLNWMWLAGAAVVAAAVAAVIGLR